MNILPALALIAILVFIHEFGHFIVAKFCGVHCTVLSIGYGKRLVGFEWRGTDYRLSMLPFGGYVLMSGSDPFGTSESLDEDIDPQSAFLNKPVWKRILIVLAGPAFNLLLPICTFTLLLMSGEVQPAPVIGEIEWGTPAHNAGLMSDDEILQINGVETPSWEIVYRQFEGLSAGKYGMVIRRDGQKKKLRFRIRPEDSTTADVNPLSMFGLRYLRLAAEIGVDDPASPAGVSGLKTGDLIKKVDGREIEDFPDLQKILGQNKPLNIEYEREQESFSTVLQPNPQWQPTGSVEFSGLNTNWGILPGTIFLSEVPETVTVDESGFMAMVGGNEEQSPAYLKGLKPGDRFSKIDGRVIHSWGDVLDVVSGAKEGEGENARARLIKLELVRAGQIKTIEIIPKMIRDTTIIGDYRYRPILGTMRDGSYADSPTVKVKHSFQVAFQKSIKETGFVIKVIFKQLKKLVVGEAAVRKNLGGPVEIVRQASDAAERGLYAWVQLMSLISISLGVMNLMPLPVLDGGQLIFYILEWVRGKPLPIRLRERVQQIGVLFLMFLMLFVMVSDIERWISGG
jgi:regulator of sigma E protease